MYVNGASVVAPLAAAGVVSQLPNTGNNIWIPVAVAVAVGMLTWAILYKKNRAAKQV